MGLGKTFRARVSYHPFPLPVAASTRGWAPAKCWWQMEAPPPLADTRFQLWNLEAIYEDFQQERRHHACEFLEPSILAGTLGKGEWSQTHIVWILGFFGWLWAQCFSSPSLSFLVCKTEIIILFKGWSRWCKGIMFLALVGTQKVLILVCSLKPSKFKIVMMKSE